LGVYKLNTKKKLVEKEIGTLCCSTVKIEPENLTLVNGFDFGPLGFEFTIEGR